MSANEQNKNQSLKNQQITVELIPGGIRDVPGIRDVDVDHLYGAGSEYTC